MGPAATEGIAIAAAAASPFFLLFGDAFSADEDDDDDEGERGEEEVEEVEEGSGEARFDGDATAGAAAAAASSDPIRSGKLRSAREPRIR